MNKAAAIAVEEVDVKRDMELVRKILFAIQAKMDLKPEILKMYGVDQLECHDMFR